MRLRESEMTIPVMAHFGAQGFEVWTEIPCLYRSVDIVAYDGKCLVAVELKVGFCMTGITQVQGISVAFDQAWLAVKARPRTSSVAKCQRYKCGLLWLSGSDLVTIVPCRKEKPLARWRQRVIDHLQVLEPGGIAGKPCLEGEGPAQECEQRIAAYREAHPRVTWAELYREIPNHYASAASMRGAMSMVRQRRAWKRRRKEQP